MTQMNSPCFRAIVAAALAIFSAQSLASQDCRELGNRAIAGIDASPLSMEPASHLGLLRSQLLESLREDCKDNPDAVYADLRMQELGAGVASPIGILSPGQHQKFLATAADYRQRFPDSAPIATLFARASHSVTAAQAAVTLDPHYAPAQAALAEALLLDGRLDEAQITLKRIPDLSVLSDGYSLQARILLARGDTRGAILAARRSLHGRKTASLIEPDGSSMLPLSQANEVLGLAHLQRQEYKAAAQALIDARVGSEQAEALLRNPPEGLRQALHARRFRPD